MAAKLKKSPTLLEACYEFAQALENIIFEGIDIPYDIVLSNKLKVSGLFTGFYGLDDDNDIPYRRGTIKIGLQQNINLYHVLETLAHELIHVKQYAEGLPVTHGKSFKYWRRRIKKQFNIDVL